MTALRAGSALAPASAVPPDAARRAALDAVAVCLALTVPTAVALAYDTRTIDGVGVWAKPIKFQLSFALHWLTIVWMLPMLGAAASRPATVRLVRIAAFATVVEVLYITVQAARGRASHFNFDTDWERLAYYGVMGPAAVVIVAATAWLGWTLLRAPAAPGRDALHRAAGWGLLLSGLLTLLVSAPLAAGAIDGPGPWIGGVRSNAAGLPLLGWSTTGGDLRVPHFVATHLLQALPLAGWLVLRSGVPRPRAWIDAAALLGVALTAAAFVQAVAGVPLVSAQG